MTMHFFPFSPPFAWIGLEYLITLIRVGPNFVYIILCIVPAGIA